MGSLRGGGPTRYGTASWAKRMNDFRLPGLPNQSDNKISLHVGLGGYRTQPQPRSCGTEVHSLKPLFDTSCHGIVIITTSSDRLSSFPMACRRASCSASSRVGRH